MTTIEIYGRVPYNPAYHRYMVTWSGHVWFFTDTINYVNGYKYAVINKNYTNFIGIITVNTNPKKVKDLLLLVHTHMPELLI